MLLVGRGSKTVEPHFYHLSIKAASGVYTPAAMLFVVVARFFIPVTFTEHYCPQAHCSMAFGGFKREVRM